MSTLQGGNQTPERWGFVLNPVHLPALYAVKLWMVVIGRDDPLEFLLFFFFWPCWAALGIFIYQLQEVEPMPPALEAQNLNHQTAREVLRLFLTRSLESFAGKFF